MATTKKDGGGVKPKTPTPAQTSSPQPVSRPNIFYNPAGNQSKTNVPLSITKPVSDPGSMRSQAERAAQAAQKKREATSPTVTNAIAKGKDLARGFTSNTVSSAVNKAAAQYKPMSPTSPSTGTGTRKTGTKTGTGKTGSGIKKPGKPFIFGPGDPAPTIPGLPDRGTGGGGGGGGGGNDPDPGPIPITEYRGGGGGGEGGYNAPPPSPVLIPGRDALNFSTTGTVNSLTSFIFEELGGTELITLMKRDTIDGIDPDYTVISNISEVRRNMDPISLVSKRTKTESYFDRFAIELLDKIPDDQYLSINNLQDFYYIASNGDLIIELENITASERIDVDIATSGTINELDTD